MSFASFTMASLRRSKLGSYGSASVLRSCAGEAAEDAIPAPLDPAREARTLKILLAINAAMFVVEMVVAWFAESTGLLADSLDMFADAAVYGLALHAVDRAAKAQLRIAHISGWVQAALAIGALAEVVRRAIVGSEPESPLMIGMASVALVANAVSVACHSP